jgi:hypothetical protein
MATSHRAQELRAMMATSDSPYWKGPRAAALQAEYARLMEGSADNNSDAGAADASAEGGAREDSGRVPPAAVPAVVGEIEADLGAEATAEIVESLSTQLPEMVLHGIRSEFVLDVPTDARPASAEAVEAFRNTQVGRMVGWGDDTAHRLGNLQARYQRMVKGLDENGKGWLDWTLDVSLKPVELAILYNRLT